jgi:spore germination cell wall hydrolase CwlJ-like protein
MKLIIKPLAALALLVMAAQAQAPLAVTKHHTLVDLDCLARVVYWESRGEPPIGQLWVAWVVINRVEHPQWPNKICLVTKQPKQFHQPQYAIKDLDSWYQAQRIALVAITTKPQHQYHYFYSPPQKLFNHHFHNAKL